MNRSALDADPAARLEEAGFSVTTAAITDRESLVARRAEFRLAWGATRLHLFVVVQHAATLDASTARRMTRDAQRYAIKHKGGLPRGLQTGTATIAVLVGNAIEEAARTSAEETPKHRFGALLLPVVAALNADEVSYFRGRMRIGRIYATHLTHTIETLVAPSLSSS